MKLKKSQKIEIKPIFDGPYFFIDEIITCINNEDIEFNFDNGIDTWDDMGSLLILNQNYKVTKFEKFENRYKLHVKDNNQNEDWFYPERFTSARLQRKEKLNKLHSLNSI